MTARPKVRFRVRGPHPGGGYAKWTVVDTEQRDMTIDTHRRRSDAVEAARELNREHHRKT